MDIFESLKNLEISEECFDEIMGIVESLIQKVSAEKPLGLDKISKAHDLSTQAKKEVVQKAGSDSEDPIVIGDEYAALRKTKNEKGDEVTYNRHLGNENNPVVHAIWNKRNKGPIQLRREAEQRHVRRHGGK